MLGTAIRVVMLAVAAAVAMPPGGLLARDKVINVPNEDTDMAAAIAKARASLAEFWKAKDAPKDGEEGFALKVRIPYGEGSGEHFWLLDIERAGDKYSGIISNDPNNATHVVKGQRYEFVETDISDWMFMRNGKMVGNETMRPLLTRMPKEQADQYRAMYEKP